MNPINNRESSVGLLHEKPRWPVTPLVGRRSGRSYLKILFATVLAVCANGCAAITNPVATGIPVRKLPPELLTSSREDLVDIPLSYLRRPAEREYRLDTGDVLGIFIEPLPDEGTGSTPPVHLPETADLPPATGIPYVVFEDGTISLPFIPPVDVRGLTVQEAQRRIVEAYTVDNDIYQSEGLRTIVTIIRPRTVRVWVVREDSNVQRQTITTGFRSSGAGVSRTTGQSIGSVVELPAYQNDLLTALTKTGGLPGANARLEVVIQREVPRTENSRQTLNESPEIRTADLADSSIRIPLRIRKGSRIPFEPDDIILNQGDIVLVQAREAELFYAGGLLPAGEYELPRDYDLGVLEAISLIGGPIFNGGIGTNNFSGDLVAPGIGPPSPSLATVIRETPAGGKVPIIVDLHRAILEPRENLILQASDFLILQETPGEAMARYATDVFGLNFFYDAWISSRSTGTVTGTLP